MGAKVDRGCVQRTLKELWIERFETLEDLRQAVRRFGRTYNQQWLIERHGYLGDGLGVRPPRSRCLLELDLGLDRLALGAAFGLEHASGDEGECSAMMLL
jgi:hypothetical protein